MLQLLESGWMGWSRERPHLLTLHPLLRLFLRQWGYYFETILNPKKLSLNVFFHGTMYVQPQLVFGRKRPNFYDSIWENPELPYKQSSPELIKDLSCRSTSFEFWLSYFIMHIFPKSASQYNFYKLPFILLFSYRDNLRQGKFCQSTGSGSTSKTSSLCGFGIHGGFEGCDSYKFKTLITGNVH